MTDVASALAALRNTAAAATDTGDWQGPGNMPTDGTMFIVQMRSGLVTVARYDPVRRTKGWLAHVVPVKPGGWCGDFMDCRVTSIDEVRFWRPLYSPKV